MRTRAPRRANATAAAEPMPLLDPVTSAVMSWNSLSFSAMVGLVLQNHSAKEGAHSETISGRRGIAKPEILSGAWPGRIWLQPYRIGFAGAGVSGRRRAFDWLRPEDRREAETGRAA